MKDKNNKPLVTIGIPTYNRANGNLRKVIERALAQTYENIEVVVSDNCSTDNTSEVVKSIKDPRLHYFPQTTNIGANNNFNFCLNQAKGDYFLLFHDDDMIDLDFVETCMSALMPGQVVGAIFTGVRVIDEDGNVLKENKNKATGFSPLEFTLGWFKGKTALYLCSTLYNTERLKFVGGFKSRHNLFTDLVPTFNLVKKYERIDIPDVKASFRRHSSNMSNSTPIKMWVEDSLYLLDVLCDLFPDERDLVNDRGKKYFCKTMYWYTSRRPKMLQRIIDYIRIYKSFDYCISPRQYFHTGKISRSVRGLKRVFISK